MWRGPIVPRLLWLVGHRARQAPSHGIPPRRPTAAPGPARAVAEQARSRTGTLPSPRLSQHGVDFQRSRLGAEVMTNLRATVIMKTDMSDSTARLRQLPESDVDVLFVEHQSLVARAASSHDGKIVKTDGDGFWLVFPSVTSAALAALAMQSALRIAQPNRGDDRLAMRIVIVLGDVLHQDGALVGEAVVLAARIEQLTPPDEIYLSPSAWLATNHVEVRTSFVESFALKGFDTPVPVYRVDPTHRTQIFTDQYIIVSDLKGFDAFTAAQEVTVVERVLDQLLELVNRLRSEFAGVNRGAAGDSHCLTFSEAHVAMAAAARLQETWALFQKREGHCLPINIAVHRGTLHAFRPYLYGLDMSIVANVERATSSLITGDGVFVTARVRDQLAGTPWYQRLQPVELPRRPKRLEKLPIFHLV
jgi:class 3 adenylate cyclase